MKKNHRNIKKKKAKYCVKDEKKVHLCRAAPL